MPEQMLQYRAASFWTRAYAPELSFGMHTEDEVRDSSAPQQAAPTPVNVTPPTEPVPVPVVEATVVETPQMRLNRLLEERGIKRKLVVPWLVQQEYITEGQTLRDLSDEHAEKLIGNIGALEQAIGGGK
jgi:hypothetical protein